MRIWQPLFLFSLAALPVQLGKLFFLKDASHVLGLPVDYLAITIYLSDIFIVSCLVTYLLQNKSRINKLLANKKSYALASLTFIVYIILASLFFKTISPTGIYYVVKLTVLVLYSFIAADFFGSLQRSKALFVEKLCLFVINFSLLWQSAVLIGEFALQRSLNVWILGERLFSATTVNIAHFDFFGQQFLRPYGTFPHPNVAAAFLVIYLVMSKSLSVKKQTNFQKFAWVAAALALLLTFSKTAIFALAIYLLLTLKNRASKLILPALILITASFFISAQRLIPFASIAERMLLSQSAYDITLSNPLFGVGPTNFIRDLSTLNLFSISQTRLLQPVHNIFLLTLAEEGVVGLLIFTAVLFSVLRRAATANKQALFLILLIFGSLDHFLLTLHQGQLLLFLTFGYILSKSNSK